MGLKKGIRNRVKRREENRVKRRGKKDKKNINRETIKKRNGFGINISFIGYIS